MNINHNKLEEAVALWETADGRVAGVVNPEGTGEIFIQAHPGYQTLELEEEMIEFAEKTYTKTGPSALCKYGLTRTTGFAKTFCLPVAIRKVSGPSFNVVARCPGA